MTQNTYVSSKKIILRLFYIFLQLSWGFLQSLLGFLLFLIFIKHPHDVYHGAIRTKWPTFNGISLGLFIFVPNENNLDLLKYTRQDSERLKERCDRISVHEYGHTIQSLILGPLYLLTVGIVSLSWSRLARYRKLRKKYGVPYSFAWPEQWADYLGEKVLKKSALR